MEELTSLAILGTVAGATTMTLLIVQIIKGLLPAINTRLIVLIVALVLTQIPAFFIGADVQAHLIAVFNGLITTVSAMGTYEVTFKAGDEAKKAGG